MTLTAEFAAIGHDSAGLSGRALAGEAGLAALAEAGSTGTPFQRAGWVSAYLAGAGAIERFRLLVVDGRDGRLMLPLAIRTRCGVAVADFVGGKHASFRAPRLVGYADQWPAEALVAALAQAARAAGIDTLTLRDCSDEIAGRRNPLLALPHRPAPDAGAKLTLTGGREAVWAAISDRDDQRKMRAKARKLAAFGPLRAGWSTDERAIAAAFEALFAWKAERFASRGIRDPFAPPEIRAFLARAAAGSEPAVRLFTLHAGERLVAVMMGASGDGQFSAMANANDLDPVIMKSSPGYLMIAELIDRLIEEGHASFDLGVGEAGYKAHFCPEPVPLVDCTLAARPAGHLAAAAFRAERALKGRLKRSAVAMALLERMRRLRAR